MSDCNGILCLCGLPGVGKSYVASQVATDTGLIILATDELRGSDLDAGIDLQDADAYYTRLFSRLERELLRGRGCILDATFFKRSWRMEAAGIILRRGGEGFLLELRAPEAVAKARLLRRHSSREGVVRESVYHSVQEKFEPILVDEEKVWFWHGVGMSRLWDPAAFYSGPGRGRFCAF